MTAETEQAARDGGWTPENEWDTTKPPPIAGFKSAEEFLQDGAAMMRSTRKANMKLTKLVEELSAKVDAQSTVGANVSALVQQNHDRERRDKDAQKQMLEGQRTAAIAEGDSEAAIQADRALRNLEIPAATAGQPSEAMKDTVKQWMRDNQWYARDPGLQDEADKISKTLKAQGMQPGPELMAAVAKEIRERFPERVASERPLGGAPGTPEVEPNPIKRGNGRSFDDLPQSAQDAYTAFRKDSPQFSKSAYLANYDWDQ